MTSRTKYAMRARLKNADIEAVILKEIGDGKTQREVAQTYYWALRAAKEGRDINFSRIDYSIAERWSPMVIDNIRSLGMSGNCFEDVES